VTAKGEMMGFEYPDNFEYEVAVNLRSTYLDDDVSNGYFGALEYVGNHAIVTGYNNAHDIEGLFASMVWCVGKMSLAEAASTPEWRSLIISQFGSDSVIKIREMHMMAKQSFIDLMKIQVGE
jgi:hypothetical protein